jgi:hypothetical protein
MLSVYRSRQITFLATQIHKRRLQRKKTFAQKKNRLLCIGVLVYQGKEIIALGNVRHVCTCTSLPNLRRPAFKLY